MKLLKWKCFMRSLKVFYVQVNLKDYGKIKEYGEFKKHLYEEDNCFSYYFNLATKL